MAQKRKEVVFIQRALKQLRQAKSNSLNKRGNSKIDTKKYFEQVLDDIRKIGTGENKGVIKPELSDLFPRARVGKHNVMLFETEMIIYIVGFIHPEQDSRRILVDQEESLRFLGKARFIEKLEKYKL